jgi:hypothetical protein
MCTYQHAVDPSQQVLVPTLSNPPGISQKFEVIVAKVRWQAQKNKNLNSL